MFDGDVKAELVVYVPFEFGNSDILNTNVACVLPLVVSRTADDLSQSILILSVSVDDGIQFAKSTLAKIFFADEVPPYVLDTVISITISSIFPLAPKLLKYLVALPEPLVAPRFRL